MLKRKVNIAIDVTVKAESPRRNENLQLPEEWDGKEEIYPKRRVALN
jgi:hypothetical protein